MSLTGWIDVAQRSRVAGWATRTDTPDTPVELVISVAATLLSPAVPIVQTLANGYRSDLDPQATGYQGRAGFDIDLRDFTLPDGSFVLDVRDALTGKRLPGSPHFIPAAGFDREPSPLLLFEIDGQPVARLPDDVMPCMPRQNGPIVILVPPRMAGVMVCTKTRKAPGDSRALGAVLSRIEIDGVPVDLGRDCFAFGFHVAEGEPDSVWRWMDGAAYLGLDAREAACTLTLHVGGLEQAAPAPTVDSPQWRISARYRIVAPSDAAVPSIAARFLGPPLSPAKRRVLVRGMADPAESSPAPTAEPGDHAASVRPGSWLGRTRPG
jgi:hypothetical protein